MDEIKARTKEIKDQSSGPPMLKKCRIQVEGFGEIRTERGHKFLEILNSHELELHNDCGGQGKCGKCRIVYKTSAPPTHSADRFFLSDDLIAQGCRLACYHYIESDCEIIIPPAPEPDLADDL